MGRVVAQQVGVGRGVVRSLMATTWTPCPGSPAGVPTDPAEAVDAYPNRHLRLTLMSPFLPASPRRPSRHPGYATDPTGLRQFGGVVGPAVGFGQGAVEDRHLQAAEGHGGRVGHHGVDLDTMGHQGGDVVGHVETLGLGRLGAQVGHVHGPGRGGPASAMPETATAARTLVKSDPGPMTIWSAAASLPGGRRGGGVGRDTDTRWMWAVSLTAVWPSMYRRRRTPSGPPVRWRRAPPPVRPEQAGGLVHARTSRRWP